MKMARKPKKTKKDKKEPVGKMVRQYRGPERDVAYNPWVRLVHGMVYDLEVIETASGRIRVNLTDGYERVRIFYPDRAAFNREWC